MKINTLEAFIKVVETGSIHAAARDLGWSQPSLSKAIKQLEGEVNASLLQRGTRGVIVTPYGKALYKRALVMSDEMRKVQEDMTQLRDKMEGKVRINLAPAAITELGPRAIRAFHDAYPDISIYVRETLPPYTIDLLREGSIDLAVTPTYAEIPSHEFTIKRLLGVKMTVLAHKSSPYAKAKSLEALIDAPWIRIGSNRGKSIYLDRVFQTAGLKTPHIGIECQTIATVLALLSGGHFLTMLPAHVLRAGHGMEDLVAVDVSDELAINNIALVHVKDRPLTRAAKLFADQLTATAQELAGQPGY
jgi:DNA-binding transcriptional LysR family regulator